MKEMTGRGAFLTVLEDEGIEYLFGNPGTTELPIMDALVDHPRLKYVLGLQESVVVAMADGYSRASGRLSCANVHVAPGLGNAIGAMFNANFFGSPVIVTAGQQERGLALTEPMLYSDLVPMAAPVVKWATEVQRVADVPRLFRRAAKVALTPPTGPVFVSLPGDVLLGAAEMELGAPTRVDSRTRPGDEGLQGLAERLLAAGAPAIIASQEVYSSDAFDELTAVAELLGAPVFNQSVPCLAVFPTEHRLFMGELTRNQQRVRRLLEPSDLLFMVGGDGLRMSIPGPVEPLPPGLPIVQVGTRDWELGKNYPTEIALDADVKETLKALVPLLESQRTPAQAEAARQRAERIQSDNWSAKRAVLMEKTENLATTKPIMPDYLMMQIANAIPDDGVIVDEGITCSRNLFNLLTVKHRQRIYGLASGGIGWGIAGALGVQLALPERRVVAVIGDGSSLYSIQALWTAAHMRLPVTFVIANNGAYSILKERLVAFGGSSVAKETMIGMDFDPPINFPALAESMGVTARRIEEPADIAPALHWAIAEERPVLLDVAVHDGFRN
ncbi:MAG: thiamine pyrophosphate-binding protein [SAR324 cluster bacterium]|nr:thiamine pyrophosphate-binding protein [SAR324 cluster bacterium]